jgi:hypothetical protein
VYVTASLLFVMYSFIKYMPIGPYFCSTTISVPALFLKTQGHSKWGVRRARGRVRVCRILRTLPWSWGSRGSVVGWGTMLQAGRSQDRVSMRWIFSIYLILPGTLWPWGHSASNRNEYQESSWGVKGGQRIRLTTSSPSVSRWLSRQNVGASTSQNPVGLHDPLQW